MGGVQRADREPRLGASAPAPHRGGPVTPGRAGGGGPAFVDDLPTPGEARQGLRQGLRKGLRGGLRPGSEPSVGDEVAGLGATGGSVVPADSLGMFMVSASIAWSVGLWPLA
jgi:hypothetical protein